MSWRTIVIESNAKLDYQLGYLVVRGADTTKVHINEIGTLIIESTAVSLTAYLVSELVKHKVNIIFCDEKRNPAGMMSAFYGSHDTSAKVKKQVEWTETVKLTVWTEIITEKIRQQIQLLERLNFESALKLQGYISEIQYGDATNREGHAAKVYFNSLFGKEFTRAEDNPVNAALNYGYTLILSSVAREVVSNGYVTQLGLFHDNMFNQFNLASDLMEPFRPIVDECVIGLKVEKFEKDEKHAMLQMLNKEIIIDERLEVLSNAIKIYVRSVFDALNENDISLIKFYKYEL